MFGGVIDKIQRSELIFLNFSRDFFKEICEINDELKAIYHSHNSICIWVFKTRDDRNKFMDETIGMLKKDREEYYISNFQ